MVTPSRFPSRHDHQPRRAPCQEVLLLTLLVAFSAGAQAPDWPAPGPEPGPLSASPAVGPVDVPFLPPGSRLAAGKPKGPTVTLQHDDDTPAYVLGTVAGHVELVKFFPEGHGTIRAIRIYYNGLGLPAQAEVHVWANFGNYNVDWASDLSGPIRFPVSVAGWSDVPLPVDGIPFDRPPAFWVGSRIGPGDAPKIVVDVEEPLAGLECVTSLVDGGFAGTYCLPNDQLASAYTDDCNGDGTTGDNCDYDYLIHVDFEYDDEVTPTFTDVTADQGLPRASLVAWGDHDGDGDDDLYLGGSLWQNDGAGVFNDVSAAAFPGAGSGGGPGLWGDYDNDGVLDLFVYGATDRLWHGEPDGTFTDVTATSGDIDDGWPTDAGGWADYDRDGFLDFYKANYEDWNAGDPIYFPDVLLHNNGDGTFTDVSALAGVYDEAPIANPRAGRGVNWGDYDGDGCIDLHVSNYRLTPNLLFHNNCDGTFENVADTNGVEGTLRPSWNAFGHTIGSQWADFDNDGDLDLLQGQLKHQWGHCFQDPTFLWRNDGGGAFTEIHDLAPIEYQEGHSDVSWGDVDNDGDLDFYITHVYSCQPAQLYLNQGDGVSFRNVTWASQLFTYNGWGVAMADGDGDGDLDVYTRGLHRNDSPAGRWLKVRLRGTWSNRAAIGARVSIGVGGETQLREVEGGKGTGTQSSLTQHFGLGAGTLVDSVTITWPSACSPTSFAAIGSDRTLLVVEPCTTLLRSTDPQALVDYVPWDPALGPVVDADALPEPLRFFRTANALDLRVSHDGTGAAVVSGSPVLVELP